MDRIDVESLSAKKDEILAELHKDVFLTPKGMIKLVQLVVVICAFSMTTSASGTSYLKLVKNSQSTGIPPVSLKASVHTKYPFTKYDYKIYVSEGNVTSDYGTKFQSNTTDIMFQDSFRSECQFFVFVGVMAMFYVLIAAVCYGWFKKISGMSELFPRYFTKVDFLVTVGFTAFYFLSVSLWSAGFSALRTDLGRPNEFTNIIHTVNSDAGVSDVCQKYSCIETDTWSKLYGSVIFGYLCIFLWGVNCWYCFKDTEWHAEPEKLGAVLQLRTENQAQPSGLQDVALEVDTEPASIRPGAI